MHSVFFKICRVMQTSVLDNKMNLGYKLEFWFMYFLTVPVLFANIANSGDISNFTNTRIKDESLNVSILESDQDKSKIPDVRLTSNAIPLLSTVLEVKMVKECNFTTERSTVDNESVTHSTSVNGGPDFSIILQGLVTEQQYNDVSRALVLLGVPCLLIAIIFNIMNLTVFGQKEMQTPSKVYLVMLSLVELIFSTLSSVSSVMSLIYGDAAIINYVFLWYTGNISRFVTTSIRRSAFILTFMITFERFMAVTFPLRFRKFKITRYPTTLSAMIIILGLVLHFPACLKYDIEAYKLQRSNKIGYRFEESLTYQKFKQEIEGIEVVATASSVYFPLIACLLLNISTIIAFKAHSRNKSKINTNQNSETRERRDRQMTITLLVSSLIFVLFSLPINVSAVVNTWHVDYRIFQREHFLFLMMFRVGFIFEIVSNCTDFMFYLILSSNFRGMFLSIFCLRFYRKGENREICSEISKEFGNLPIPSSQDTNID